MNEFHLFIFYWFFFSLYSLFLFYFIVFYYFIFDVNHINRIRIGDQTKLWGLGCGPGVSGLPNPLPCFRSLPCLADPCPWYLLVVLHSFFFSPSSPCFSFLINFFLFYFFFLFLSFFFFMDIGGSITTSEILWTPLTGHVAMERHYWWPMARGQLTTFEALTSSLSSWLHISEICSSWSLQIYVSYFY